ncbi:MAG: hypothetical protein ACXVHY_10935, partial [Methanobacterium sp.]
MLEYVSIIKKNPNKLSFVDTKSLKEWESIINYKLSEYKESAYIDSTVKVNKMIVVLELNSKKLNPEDIENEKEQFKGYYKRILEDIENSEFYDLYLR